MRTNLNRSKKLLLSFFTAIFMISAVFYVSCQKSNVSTEIPQEGEPAVNKPAKNVNFNGSSQESGFMQNHLKSNVTLSDTSKILKQLLSSDVWKSVPLDIRSQIKDVSKPSLQSYDNVEVQAIIFNLATSDKNIIYNSLAVYVYNDKFLPVIVKSIKQDGGYTELSIADVNGDKYAHLLVNKENKVGKFKVEKDIPFNRITGNYDIEAISIGRLKSASLNSSVAIQSSETCPQKTHTFSACMSCAIAECEADWVCFIGCGVEFVGCMVVFAASCAFHA